METKTNNNFDSRLRDLMGTADFEKAIKDTEFAIDFGGFYESIHTEYIDRHIEDLLISWVDVDYKKTYENYAKCFVDYINFSLNQKLKYVELDSPKYYNFRNDKIIVSINEIDKYNLIQQYRNDNQFVKWVNEASASRDGFTSFCSGIDNLINEQELLLEYIFTYILWHEEENEFILESVGLHDFMMDDFEVVMLEGRL
tara:strand:+ start:3668 stop:4264 length:597 start_codon:yes stop_codon:yes gene_type:complete